MFPSCISVSLPLKAMQKKMSSVEGKKKSQRGFYVVSIGCHFALVGWSVLGTWVLQRAVLSSCVVLAEDEVGWGPGLHSKEARGPGIPGGLRQHHARRSVIFSTILTHGGRSPTGGGGLPHTHGPPTHIRSFLPVRVTFRKHLEQKVL